MYSKSSFQSILKDAGLKVTPQRLAVLEAVYNFKEHPSSEAIASYVRNHHPNIAVGTVYNILDFLVQKNIISRVKTEKGAMLYDAVSEKHHHLYCEDSNRIEDYFDKDLDQLLEDFFRKKKIEGFEIEDIKLQLVGRFKK
jgi:Fur family peroxide stress response transcriptional regulator